MLKKFEITLELLKSQKNNLIQIIKDNKNDTIKNNQLIESIYILDNKIIENNNKINKENSTINLNIDYKSKRNTKYMLWTKNN